MRPRNFGLEELDSPFISTAAGIPSAHRLMPPKSLFTLPVAYSAAVGVILLHSIPLTAQEDLRQQAVALIERAREASDIQSGHNVPFRLHARQAQWPLAGRCGRICVWNG